MCNVLVGTGEVYHEAIDVDLPGHPPFLFKRAYTSTSTKTRSLGIAWRHNFETSLIIEEKGLRIDDGIDGDIFYPFSECDGVKGPQIIRNEDALSLISEDGTRRTFFKWHKSSPQWLLTRQVNSCGTWLNLIYSRNRLVKIQDSQKREVMFTYEHDLLTKVEVHHHELIIQTRYIYDGLKRLVQIIDHSGATQHFEYDRHLVVHFVNKAGVSRYFCYDDQLRCTLSWYDEDVNVRRFQFKPDGQATLLSDSNGNRAVYKFTEQGSVQMIIDPIGRITESIFDKNGRLAGTILPDGSIRNTVIYDPDTRTHHSTDVRGSLTTYIFNDRGEITTVQNSEGDSKHFDRNNCGKVVGIRAPEGAHWRFEYDEHAALSKVIDPKGNWIARSESGNVVELSDEHGVIGRYLFDELGNLLQEVDAQKRKTTYQYEGQDKLVCMVLPDGREIRWRYDTSGRIIGVIDSLGRTTRYEYGQFGSVIGKVLPDGRRINLTFDKEHNLTKIINCKGEATQLGYDISYRLVDIVYFDGRKISYEYDLRNRPVVRSNGRGERIRFEYDGGINITRQEGPDGTIQINSFDRLGRLVAMATEPPLSSGTKPHSSSFAYNGNNYVRSEEHDGYKVEYIYDDCSNLIATRDSLGRELQYQIGPRRRVARIIDSERQYAFTYSSSGELREIALPNGMTQRFHFDVCSRLTRREVISRDGRLVAWRDYAYDAADQLSSMEDWRMGGFRYVYDLAGRLTSVSRSDGTVAEAYSYDSEDNLLSSPDFASCVIGKGNRIYRSDSTEYVYDGDGCLIAVSDDAHRSQLIYDHNNQLIQVIRDGTIVGNYEYDLMGRRVRKTAPDDSIDYYYHANKLKTFISMKYGRSDIVYAPDTFVPISQTYGNHCYYYSFDQIGTPTELWDEEGNLVMTLNSRAYGAERTITALGATVIPIPFHFLGQYVDEETCLHYSRFRYYSPTIGRFITVDPLGLTKTLNLYKYPTNPMNWVDPLGLAPLMINCRLEEREFTPCEQYAAQEKLRSINAASGNRRRRTCTECREDKQKKYFEKTCGGNPPKGSQVDHILELQLGGSDNCCDNLMAIPRSVNASFGSQIKNLIKEIAVDDCVPQFQFCPPGCADAHLCTGRDRDQAVVRGNKDDGKDCSKESPLDC